jgi:hypothetical protein
LTSCGVAKPVPVIARDPIPAELLAETPAPLVPKIYTASTPGTLLIQFSDSLGSCNLDKRSISRWQELLMNGAKKNP